MSDPPVAKAAEPEPDAIELRENEPASTDPASHTRQFELASTEIVELAGTEIDLGRLHLGGFSDHLADVLALLVAESKKHAQTLTVMQAWSSHLEQQVEDPNPSLQQRADTWRARQGFGPWKTDWIAHKRVSRVKAMMMGRRTAGANLRYAFVAWRWWHTASVRLEDLLAWVADERCGGTLRVWGLHGAQRREAQQAEAISALRSETFLLRARVTTATAALQAEQSAHQQSLLVMRAQMGQLEISRQEIEPYVLRKMAEEFPSGPSLLVHKDEDFSLYTALHKSLGIDDVSPESFKNQADVLDAALPTVAAMRRQLLSSHAAFRSFKSSEDLGKSGDGEQEYYSVAPGSTSYQMGVLARALDAAQLCAFSLNLMAEGAQPQGGFIGIGDSIAVARSLRGAAEATAKVGSSVSAQVEAMSLLAARADVESDGLAGDAELAGKWAEVARMAAVSEFDTISMAAAANRAAEVAAGVATELISRTLAGSTAMSPAESASLHGRALASASAAAAAAVNSLTTVFAATKLVALDLLLAPRGGAGEQRAKDAGDALERVEAAITALRTAGARAQDASVALADAARADTALLGNEQVATSLEQARNTAVGAAGALASARDAASFAAGVAGLRGGEGEGSGLRHQLMGTNYARRAPVPFGSDETDELGEGGEQKAGVQVSVVAVAAAVGGEATAGAPEAIPTVPASTSVSEIAANASVPKISASASGSKFPTSVSFSNIPASGSAGSVTRTSRFSRAISVNVGKRAFTNAVAIRSFDDTSMTVQTASGEIETVPIDVHLAAMLRARASRTSEATDKHTAAMEEALLGSSKFLDALKRGLGVLEGMDPRSEGMDPRLLAAVRRLATQGALAFGGEKETPREAAAPTTSSEDPSASARRETDAAVAALGRFEKQLALQAATMRRILATPEPDGNEPALPAELLSLVQNLPAQTRAIESLRADLDVVRRRLAPSGPLLDDEVESAQRRAVAAIKAVEELRAEIGERMSKASDALEAFKQAEGLVDEAISLRLDKATEGDEAPSAIEMLDRAVSDGDLNGIAEAVAAMTARLVLVQQEFEGKADGLRADVNGVFEKMSETEAALPRLRSHVDTVQSELLSKIAGSDDLQRLLQGDIANCASKEALEGLDELIGLLAKEEDVEKWKELLQEEVNGVQLSANQIARRADELAARLDEAMRSKAVTEEGRAGPPLPGVGGAGALIAVVVQACRAIDGLLDNEQSSRSQLSLQPSAKASIKSQFMPGITGKGSRIKQYALLKTMLHTRFKGELDTIARARFAITPPSGHNPRLTDVYIYGDDGRPYRGSLNVEVTKGESARSLAHSTEGRRKSGSRPKLTGARVVAAASTPAQPFATTRLADHTTISQGGLEVATSTIIAAGPTGNPLGRRVINPITPYELWGLKHPSLNKKRATTAVVLEPLAKPQRVPSPTRRERCASPLADPSMKPSS